MLKTMKILTLVLGLLYLPLMAHADISHARKLFDEQRYAETLESIDKILAASATHQRALFLKALTLQRIGRIDDAIGTYQFINSEYPKSPEAYNNLAALYAQQGNHARARDALLAALNTHTSYATAYKNLGNIYSRMASNAYNKALELEGNKKPAALTLTTINKMATPDKTIVVAKKSTPITKTTSAKAKPQEVKLIIETIKAWSNAWSAQNSDAYFSYYADSFNPSNGFSRQRWEQDRRIRLQKPTFIRVSIQSPKVTLISERTARFTFQQNYQSNRFRDAVTKTLLLQKVDGSWQILEEYTAS